MAMAAFFLAPLAQATSVLNTFLGPDATALGTGNNAQLVEITAAEMSGGSITDGIAGSASRMPDSSGTAGALASFATWVVCAVDAPYTKGIALQITTLRDAHPSSSCEGSDQGANLGAFDTAADCHGSAIAQELTDPGSCPMFMFAVPSWGCRCCYQSTEAHGSWSIFHTVAPPSAPGAALAQMSPSHIQTSCELSIPLRPQTAHSTRA